MRHSLIAATLVLVGALCPAAWKPVEGKIMTRWVADLSPENALPEYPRPMMVRADWMNLNGMWDYTIQARTAAAPANYQEQILVPFAVESALSGVGKKVGDANRLWYRRTFEIPAKWSNQRVLLHFGAVDWDTDVWVNGHYLGNHKGGYTPFSFEITGALYASGPQEIVVAVWDPTDRGTQPRGKQVFNPNGIWYTAVTGIWQTVWIEPVPKAAIANLKITPDVDNKQVKIEVMTSGDAKKLSVAATATGAGFSGAASSTDKTMTLVVANPRLWSPDDPFLYDLTVQLKDGGKVIDEVKSYFGMRKIELKKDSEGVNRLFLNDVALFQYGPLDQGWWPDGLYTAPTDEALRYDIEITKELGFNMLRKHVKVEPQRLYYWCDKIGVLVWQDMPSGDGYIHGEMPDLNRTSHSANQFEREYRELIEANYNHPSIVMWVPFNEGWGQFDTARIVAWTKELDPTRLVNNASGWTDRGVGDVHDIHVYPGPATPPLEDKRAAVLGEFGGLGLPIKGHTWQDEKNWGYRSYTSPEALTDAYASLMHRLWLLIGEGLCAAVYTQTTDVEIEVNGVLTYDRAVIKMDAETLKPLHRRLYQKPPTVKVLVPNAQQGKFDWKYTIEKPQDNWFAAGFNDAGWKTGAAAFGTANTPGIILGTEWKTPDIWVRRTFELDKAEASTVFLSIIHDEDAEVYLNGVKAAELTGHTGSYTLVPVSLQAQKALKKGTNVLAIHCRQTAGGQSIDAGLVELVN
jgi:hypothetical protein